MQQAQQWQPQQKNQQQWATMVQKKALLFLFVFVPVCFPVFDGHPMWRQFDLCCFGTEIHFQTPIRGCWAIVWNMWWELRMSLQLLNWRRVRLEPTEWPIHTSTTQQRKKKCTYTKYARFVDSLFNSQWTLLWLDLGRSHWSFERRLWWSCICRIDSRNDVTVWNSIVLTHPVFVWKKKCKNKNNELVTIRPDNKKKLAHPVPFFFAKASFFSYCYGRNRREQNMSSNGLLVKKNTKSEFNFHIWFPPFFWCLSQPRFLFFGIIKKSMSIELILGNMFAGKSSRLLTRLKRFQIAKKKCICVKYCHDRRYENVRKRPDTTSKQEGTVLVSLDVSFKETKQPDSPREVVTHRGDRWPALSCECISEIMDTLKEYDVIGMLFVSYGVVSTQNQKQGLTKSNFFTHIRWSVLTNSPTRFLFHPGLFLVLFWQPCVFSKGQNRRRVWIECNQKPKDVVCPNVCLYVSIYFFFTRYRVCVLLVFAVTNKKKAQCCGFVAMVRKYHSRKGHLRHLWWRMSFDSWHCSWITQQNNSKRCNQPKKSSILRNWRWWQWKVCTAVSTLFLQHVIKKERIQFGWFLSFFSFGFVEKSSFFFSWGQSFGRVSELSKCKTKKNGKRFAIQDQSSSRFPWWLGQW